MTAIYAFAAFAIVLVSSTAYGANDAPGHPEPARPFIMEAYFATQAPVASTTPADGFRFPHLRSDLAKFDPERPQIWHATAAVEAPAWDRN